MEDFCCPRCRTTKFQNPSMKMMVNVCGHGLCESCVDLLFLKGSGSCPECKIALRRNNFRVQLFEDSKVEKDIDIRRRILKDYNKKEEDFATLREYNDYLEEIETIVFNLTNNIDVIETNKKIEQYKKDNREQIQKNRNRLSKDEYEIERILEMERDLDELRRREIVKEETETKKRRIKQKEALIDELMFSNGDAKNIVETFALKNKQVQEEEEEEEKSKLPQKATKFSSGIEIGVGGQSGFLPVPINDDPIYEYKFVMYDPLGPPAPTETEIVDKQFIKHIRAETEQEKAGGFTTSIACMKALQEAMMGLYCDKVPSKLA